MADTAYTAMCAVYWPHIAIALTAVVGRANSYPHATLNSVFKARILRLL